MNTPYISIIIPVFKAEDFLEHCLDSILSQSFTNWECILVDDGSPDNSGHICNAYTSKDSRFRVVHKENSGASSARNVGLELAVGEWITFIDSDDSIDANYFNIEGLEYVDLAVQRWRFLSEEDTREHLQEGVYTGNKYVEFMTGNIHKDIFRMVAAKFLKREIIESHNIRFDTNITLGEDTIFMLEYYRFIKSVSVNNTSYYLYYRPDNWNTSKYLLSPKQVKYNIQHFYRSYLPLGIKSGRLVQFMLGFYFRRISKGNSLPTRLYLKTLPEYLKLEKHNITSGGVRASLKYYLLRTISLFR